MNESNYTKVEITAAAGKSRVLVIIGSASQQSANLTLMQCFTRLTASDFRLTIYRSLNKLPHFDPERSLNNPPPIVVRLRRMVQETEGVIICTPEYIFSIPSGLKNLLEWCVASTVFQNKPVGLITASAHGAHGHTELQLIMKTLMARLNPATTLLIQGVKGKIIGDGENVDEQTKTKLYAFADAYKKLLTQNNRIN